MLVIIGAMLVYVGGLHCGLSWCDICKSCGSTTEPQLQAGRHHASNAIHAVNTCKHMDLPVSLCSAIVRSYRTQQGEVRMDAALSKVVCVAG
jgi:hypothetical protein